MDQNLITLERKLKEKERLGLKSVVWKLEERQKEYLEENGYQIIPWLYCIITKEIMDVSKSKSKLIKDIHYAKKRGCKMLYWHLSFRDLELLRKYEIWCALYKYKIILK